MEARNLKKVRTIPTGRLANRAAEVAHKTIDEFQDLATQAEQKLVRRAEAGGRSMVNQAGGVVQKVTNYIEENPFASVTLALVAGILATMMLQASGVNLGRLLTPPSPPKDDATD